MHSVKGFTSYLFSYCNNNSELRYCILSEKMYSWIFLVSLQGSRRLFIVKVCYDMIGFHCNDKINSSYEEKISWLPLQCQDRNAFIAGNMHTHLLWKENIIN